MKELNELVSHAQIADAESTNMYGVEPDKVFAIWEAFRALEQRAEAAEAKLAELDKQDPYAYAYRFKGKQGLSFRKLDIDKCDSRIMPLFTRPAPAINLADLLPDEIGNYESITNVDWMTPRTAAQTYWNACRDTILRNIEEHSK